MKQNDNLQRYISLRSSLEKERQQLEQRLGEITRVLGTDRSGSLQPSPAVARWNRSKVSIRRRRTGQKGKQEKNKLSLKQAIASVTAKRPLTKQEILQELHRIGFKMNTSDPMNYIGSVVYAKANKFKNQGGKFSPNRTPGK